MPLESKMKVLTSASAPVGGISWPFQTKVTPAALPTLATTSRAARTEVLAGAMRVSFLTGCPSARMEIQEVSVARITRVSGAVDFSFCERARSRGERFDFCKGGTVAPWLPASLSSAGEGADTAASAGG